MNDFSTNNPIDLTDIPTSPMKALSGGFKSTGTEGRSKDISILKANMAHFFT